MINGGRSSFLSAPGVQGLLEGGVPIVKDGQVLGAVGVSGVKSTEDAQIARAGIAALSSDRPRLAGRRFGDEADLAHAGLARRRQRLATRS